MHYINWAIKQMNKGKKVKWLDWPDSWYAERIGISGYYICRGNFHHILEMIPKYFKEKKWQVREI